MTDLSRIVLAASLASLAFACSKKDDAAADAAPEAAPVATQAAADAAPDPAEAGAAPTAAKPIPVRPTATTTAKANACPAANQAAFVGGGGAKECHVTCNTTQDCLRSDPKSKCTGSGTLMNADGTRGGAMKFCQ